MRKRLLLAPLAATLGCNAIADVTNKQVDAVNAVVKATCDRYQACGKIGSGETYSTRTDCENNARDFWNAQWPATDCDGHIYAPGLQTCTDRIASTDCNSFLDQINTAYNTCNKSDVCQ